MFGVRFVTVTNQGWDTHTDNFKGHQRLLGPLDAGLAAMYQTLSEKGLLDRTLVVVMGEFGRTPTINNNTGRDHFPAAWSTVLAGGGVKGGQVYGKTTDDGMKVADRPVSTPDFLATICGALGIDPLKQNMTNVGRPARIVDPEAEPLEELLT